MMCGQCETKAAPLDRAQFTTLRFLNAPESIMRIKSVDSRDSDSVVIHSVAGACTNQNGSVYSLIVTNAKAAHFTPNELVITGFATYHDRLGNHLFWAVRRVSKLEAHEAGCPREQPSRTGRRPNV